MCSIFVWIWFAHTLKNHIQFRYKHRSLLFNFLFFFVSDANAWIEFQPNSPLTFDNDELEKVIFHYFQVTDRTFMDDAIFKHSVQLLSGDCGLRWNVNGHFQLEHILILTEICERKKKQKSKPNRISRYQNLLRNYGKLLAKLRTIAYFAIHNDLCALRPILPANSLWMHRTQQKSNVNVNDSPDFDDGSINMIATVRSRIFVGTFNIRFNFTWNIFERIAMGVVEILIPILLQCEL